MPDRQSKLNFEYARGEKNLHRNGKKEHDRGPLNESYSGKIDEGRRYSEQTSFPRIRIKRDNE